MKKIEDSVDSIGTFTLGAVIGEGHIGRVYRAVDSRTGAEVALKVLLDDSPVGAAARAYFDNEIAVLKPLHHPRIPALLGHGANPPHMALTLIDGQDGDSLLNGLTEGTFFPQESVIRWGAQLCEALSYLHNHTPPVVFRDLKPSHLMVDRQGQAWLIDFNLAKIMPPSRRVEDAEPIGTEGFSPPEQHRGVVTPLVDIYALGATLHNLLTRINPRNERLFTYAPARAANPQVSKGLAAVLAHALAYEPEDRFQSAEAMQNALVVCL